MLGSSFQTLAKLFEVFRSGGLGNDLIMPRDLTESFRKEPVRGKTRYMHVQRIFSSFIMVRDII